jgi:hypothetical protein
MKTKLAFLAIISSIPLNAWSAAAVPNTFEHFETLFNQSTTPAQISELEETDRLECVSAYSGGSSSVDMWVKTSTQNQKEIHFSVALYNTFRDLQLSNTKTDLVEEGTVLARGRVPGEMRMQLSIRKNGNDFIMHLGVNDEAMYGNFDFATQYIYCSKK